MLDMNLNPWLILICIQLSCTQVPIVLSTKQINLQNLVELHPGCITIQFQYNLSSIPHDQPPPF